MYLIDLGDAMVETKQMAPGTKPDYPFVFGILSGGGFTDGIDMEMARLMLTRDRESE